MPRSRAKSRSEQLPQVPQHGRLGVVLREHGVAEDGPPPHEGLGQGERGAPSPTTFRTEGAHDHCQVGCRGRLAAGDADSVVVDEPEQHAAAPRLLDDRPGAPGCPHVDGVEELLVLELESGLAQPSGQSDRLPVHHAGDLPQAARPVVDRVHRGHHGQQHLRRADVGGGLLPADVLLTGLERQPVGGVVLGVDRQPDQAAGQVALEPGLDRHEGGVGPAVPQRDAEPLRRADDDVRSPMARRLQQCQGEEVRRHGDHGAPLVRLFGEHGEVPHGTGAPRILLDQSEELAVGQPCPEVADLDQDPERLETGLEYRDGLRQAVGVHDDTVRLDRGATPHEGHGLGHGGALVEQRGVRRIEPGEVGHHGLEIQECFEAALADLGLVRGVGGVPGGALEHVPLDHARCDRAVVAQAHHRLGEHVARCELTQFVRHLSLGGRRREPELPEAPHRVRDGCVDECVQGLVAENLEHRRLLVVRRPDMTTDELVVVLGCAGLGGWTQFAHGASSHAPRVTRRSLDVLPALSSDLRVSPHVSDFHLRCGHHQRVRFPELPRRSGMSA